MKHLSCIIVACGIFGIGFYSHDYYASKKEAKETETNKIISTNFLCKGGKSISSLFFEDKVELSLSDKRQMLLLQAISASGVRYTNNDESFIFWNKGNTAFVTEKERLTYEGCVEEVATSTP